MRHSSFAVPILCFALAACGPAGGSTHVDAPAAKPAETPAATAAANGVPTRVGDCVQTTVREVGYRLQGVAGSGSAILYANGLGQVSYDTLAGIDHSRPGDAIRLCLVSLPQDCPPGDDRGKIYAATNQRTGGTWSEADSEHMCGGA